MKHSVNELYRINGKPGLYTKEYLHTYGVQVGRWNEKGKAHSVVYLCGSSVLNIHDANSDRKIYKFGEHTYFDTEAELMKAKKDYIEIRTANARRKEALKKFETLSTEELEKIAIQLGL